MQLVITFYVSYVIYYYLLFITIFFSIVNIVALKYSLGKGCLKVENEVTVKWLLPVQNTPIM